MLASLHLGDGANVGTADGRIALDCSIRAIPRRGNNNGDNNGNDTAPPQLYTISTTDFFFPLVDSPYTQGRIGAANVLSDLYAEGVEHTDFVLMLLAACRDMAVPERTICTTEMVRGFRDACTEAGTVVTGGQTVLNPWPMIGGVATSVVAKTEFVSSDGAQPGHVVVLTKPLGTQIAVNVHQWRTTTPTPHRHWTALSSGESPVLTEESAKKLMHKAVCSMARLNKHGARCMLQHGATAGTDVTGFGILGHAQNLTENQVAAVGMELHTLPCLAHSMAVNQSGLALDFGLMDGTSAETSGGLLVALPSQEAAHAFLRDLQQLDDTTDGWIVGRMVEDPQRQARIVDNVTILEV